MFDRIKRRLAEFNKIAQIEELARRYLALNTFDGILVILGILIASFFAKIYSHNIIIVASIGAATALAISGISGAFIIEQSERKGVIRKLEKQLGISLKKTDIVKAHKFAVIILALINGIAPFVAAIIIILPFILSMNIITAYYTSFFICGALLFLIGVFLGRISKENLLKSGIKMLLVGVICFVVIFLIERLT